METYNILLDNNAQRGMKDVQLKEFVINHFIDTHKAAKDTLKSMGILDNAGAAKFHIKRDRILGIAGNISVQSPALLL